MYGYVYIYSIYILFSLFPFAFNSRNQFLLLNDSKFQNSNKYCAVIALIFSNSSVFSIL